MEKGEIIFPKPSECTIHKSLHEMKMKKFGEDNFSGLKEFGVIN